MIGNDVIDILQSRKESNWQRKGFIEKIFTPDEQSLISDAANPEIMVWMLWSMKEAAYKIYNRKTLLREYIPKKLICFIELQKSNFTTGKVSCGKHIYYTKSILSKNKIHTVAVSNLDDLKKITEIEKRFVLKDSNNIPYLETSYQNKIRDVSVSHHGRFEKVVTIVA